MIGNAIGRVLFGRLCCAPNIDAGAVEETARIVARIRALWPQVQILQWPIRLCREALTGSCEANRVGLASRLAGNFGPSTQSTWS